MKQFDELQVNPVTLTSRNKQGIPCLRTVIEEQLDRYYLQAKIAK